MVRQIGVPPVSDVVNRVANDHPSLVVETHVRVPIVEDVTVKRKARLTDDRQIDLF